MLTVKESKMVKFICTEKVLSDNRCMKLFSMQHAVICMQHRILFFIVKMSGDINLNTSSNAGQKEET